MINLSNKNTKNKNKYDKIKNVEMSIFEHLEELRYRAIKATLFL